MSRGNTRLVERSLWNAEELEADLASAIEGFRDERLQEPLASYIAAYDSAEEVIDALLRTTGNLASLQAEIADLLQMPGMLDALRYLAAPPISEDDLKVLIEATSLSPRVLATEPELASRLVQTIQAVIDPRRFPWHSEQRDPTPEERHAAVVASTALISTQRVATQRRNEGKQAQEATVRRVLLDHGLRLVTIPGNTIDTLIQSTTTLLPRPRSGSRTLASGTSYLSPCSAASTNYTICSMPRIED